MWRSRYLSHHTLFTGISNSLQLSRDLKTFYDIYFVPKKERIGFVAVAVAGYGTVVIAGVVYVACHQLFNILWAASAPHLVVSIGAFFIINARVKEAGRMRSWLAVRCVVGVFSIVAAVCSWPYIAQYSLSAVPLLEHEAWRLWKLRRPWELWRSWRLWKWLWWVIPAGRHATVSTLSTTGTGYPTGADKEGTKGMRSSLSVAIEAAPQRSRDSPSRGISGSSDGWDSCSDLSLARWAFGMEAQGAAL